MTPAKLAAQPSVKPEPPKPNQKTCKQRAAFCKGDMDCCAGYFAAQVLRENSSDQREIRNRYTALTKAWTTRKLSVPASLQIQIARSWLKGPNYNTVVGLLGSVRGWPTPEDVDPQLLEQLQADLAAQTENLSQATPSAQVQRGLLLVIQVLTQGKSDADKKQALAPALALCTQVAASLNGSKPKDRDDLVLKWHKVLSEKVKGCPAIVSGQQAAGLSAAVPVATSQSPGKATRSPGLGNPEWPLMPSVSAAKAANGSDPKKDKEKDKQGPSATPVAAALSPTPGTTAGTPAVPPVTLAAASPKPVSLAPASSAPASPGHLSSDAAESPRPAQAGVALIAPSEDKAPRVSPPRPVARWKVAVVTIAGVAALGLGVGLGVGLGAPGQYFRSMSLSVQP